MLYWWENESFPGIDHYSLKNDWQSRVTSNEIYKILWSWYSSSSILLTDIYKGWNKSQHIINGTNVVHLTGYLKHVTDNAMPFQSIYAKQGRGHWQGKKSIRKISPSGNCQCSGSGTDWIVELTTTGTPSSTWQSSQCRTSGALLQLRYPVKNMKGFCKLVRRKYEIII